MFHSTLLKCVTINQSERDREKEDGEIKCSLDRNQTDVSGFTVYCGRSVVLGSRKRNNSMKSCCFLCFWSLDQIGFAQSIRAEQRSWNSHLIINFHFSTFDKREKTLAKRSIVMFGNSVTLRKSCNGSTVLFIRECMDGT